VPCPSGQGRAQATRASSKGSARPCGCARGEILPFLLSEESEEDDVEEECFEEEISDEEISEDDEEISEDDEEISEDDEEISSEDEDVSEDDEELSSEDGDVDVDVSEDDEEDASEDDENVSGNGEDISDEDDEDVSEDGDEIESIRSSIFSTRNGFVPSNPSNACTKILPNDNSSIQKLLKASIFFVVFRWKEFPS